MKAKIIFSSDHRDSFSGKPFRVEKKNDRQSVLGDKLKCETGHCISE